MSGQRTRARVATLLRRNQRDIGLARLREFAEEIERHIDEHAVEQAREHGFDRGFPTGFDVERFTEARRLVEAEAFEPFVRRRFLLT
ncbi:MAG TPA: hypothetical protein VFA35_09445 [Burkholderiaceae bacterium]|nr:hypothetical protein [Burkholderiaceae bacterium]